MIPKQSNANLSSKLLGYSATTSLLGRPIAVGFGLVRVSPNVIWTGGWDANPVNGGKGNKGKGGTQQYDYITNVLMGLGQGPAYGIRSIWRDKDKFNLADATETCSGVSSYRALIGGVGNPYWWVINIGVARLDPFSYTVTDFGSPASVSNSGSMWTPMQLVPSAPAAGQYTLAVGSDGFATYGFSAADQASGKTIQVTYSYQINNFSVQGSPMTHLNLVLFPGNLGQAPWNYLANNPDFASQALGYSELAYIGSGQFDLGSAGVIPNLNFEEMCRCAWGGSIVDCNPADIIDVILTDPLCGVLGWGTPGTGSGFGPVTVSGVCNITGTAMVVTSGSLATLVVGQQIALGGVPFTLSKITDSTHATLNVSPGNFTGLPWSATSIQAYSSVTGSSVWLPTPSAATSIGSGGQVYKYCAANGLFVSYNYDQQSSAREVINQLLEIANSDAFWSEGVLKFACYGDTTAVGNGYTYNPATQPIYDVDDRSMVCAPGEEPLKFKAPDVLDVKNEVTVEWRNRSADYATGTLPPAQDASMVAKYGRRPASTSSYPQITTQPVAVAVQNTLLKRAVYIDGAGSFEVTLFPHYCLLDPADLFTVLEPYIIGPTKKPLRITRIEEDEQCCLKFTLEEFPWSASAPTLYPSQGHAPTQAGFFAAPGHVNAPMFVQMPSQKTQGNPYVLGIALSGSENWGGAAVHVSTDGGNSYSLLGVANAPATMGILTANLPASADPDTTTHDLQVSLTESFGDLASYTQAQADANVPLIAVESELLSYQTADLTGTYQYGLTYLRRGVYDTVDSAHPAGSPFAVVDDGLFQYAYPASAIGSTLYFKFCSVNQAGLSQEDISQVPAYPCFIAGPRTPFAWAPGYEAPVTGDPLTKAQSFGLQPAPIPNDDGSVTSLLNVFANPPLNGFTKAITSPVLNSAIAVISGGVKWVTISAGGTGHLNGLSGQFPLTFASGAAAGYAVVAAGVVVNAIITTPGSYGSAPAVSFTAGGGTGTTGTAVLSTGGTVAAGSYAVAVDAFDAVSNPLETPLSNVVEVVATAGSSEIVYNITWPVGSFGGRVFVASPDALHAFHYEDSPGAGGSTSGVANYGLGTVQGTFFGPPDQRYDHALLRWWLLRHAGSWAEPCSAVGSFTITFGGAAFTVNQYANAYVSLLGCADQTRKLPIFDAKVVSNTATTLTLNVDPSGIVLAGDTIVKAMQLSSISSTAFSDSGAISFFEPSGFAIHAEGGRVAWIAKGPGAGQKRLIQDNGAGAGPFTLAQPWGVLPTADSIIYIVEAAVFGEYPTHSVQMSSYANWDGNLATLEVSNIAGQTFLVQALTVDADGGFDDTNAPVRAIWMPGQPGNNASPGLTLQVQGTLAIGSDLCPIVALNAARNAKAVTAYVKIAPVGSNLTMNINLGGTLWMSLTILAGTNSISATPLQISGAATLTANTNVTLDLTAVGGSPTGSDLSVFIYN